MEINIFNISPFKARFLSSALKLPPPSAIIINCSLKKWLESPVKKLSIDMRKSFLDSAL